MAVVITSTTSSQEAMDHAVSENWREPFVPKEAESKPEPEPKGVELSPEEAPKEEAANSESPQPKKEHRKPSAKEQARFDRITKEKYEAEAKALREAERREALEKEFAEYKTKNAAAPQFNPDEEPKWKDWEGKVTPDEFATKIHGVWEKNQSQKQQAEQLRTVRMLEGKAKYSDWTETLEKAEKDGVEVSPAANQSISESENPVDIIYHLAKHPEEADKINAMPPSRAAAAIVRLSEKLAEEASAPPPKPKVKPPEPIAPVGGSSTRSSLGLDDPKIPIGEYIKIRNKQEREARGRR